MKLSRASIAGFVFGSAALFCHAQSPAAAGKTNTAAVHMGPRQPPLISPEVGTDRRVTFRLYAPQASQVSVAGDVFQGLSQPGLSADAIPFTKGPDGLWTGTSRVPFKPGAWRYHFMVDGMTVVDGANQAVSPYQRGLESLLVTPGDFSEQRDVPHGAVSKVWYVASTLGHATREMYVYTPPGYEKGKESYPVLYLIHGGGETAASWPTVGRANEILDNLIADGKALPMIIVMPSGWTPLGGQVMTGDATKDPFNDELMKDIIPYVDGHFRTKADPDHRALSGLSMGGIQTLNIGLHNLGEFRYLAVMSSGWISEADRQAFFSAEASKIPTYNKELKLFWWGWGQTDIARPNAIAVTDRFKKLGVHLETEETSGGHEWMNWRLYLYQVSPKLFR